MGEFLNLLLSADAADNPEFGQQLIDVVMWIFIVIGGVIVPFAIYLAFRLAYAGSEQDRNTQKKRLLNVIITIMIIGLLIAMLGVVNFVVMPGTGGPGPQPGPIQIPPIGNETSGSGPGGTPTIPPGTPGTNTPNFQWNTESYDRPAPFYGMVLEQARQRIGRPYIWGGTGPAGYDCSGFIFRIFNAAGINHPIAGHGEMPAGARRSQRMFNATERTTSPRPGDLVFFGSGPNGVTHVGLYLGNRRMIDSSGGWSGMTMGQVDNRPGAGVGERVFTNWHLNNIVGFGRVVPR